MSERIRLRSETVQKAAVPTLKRRTSSPWRMSPRAFVLLAILAVTASGYWLWNCATLQSRATRGDATAQYRMGKRGLESANTPAEYAHAVEWIRLAAEQGDAKAQAGLGLLYLRGVGLQLDYCEASKWLHRAAVQGVAIAQNELGIMYAKGTGVSQNLQEALIWCGKAAAQGSAVAKRNLALVQMVKRSFVADLATAAGKDVALESISADGITVKLQPKPGTVVVPKLKPVEMTSQFKELCGYFSKGNTNPGLSQLDSLSIRL